MNLENHRSPYGTLKLSPASIRQLQQEWQFVESPAAPARFLDFPFVPETSAPLPEAKRRTEKRPLAA